MKTDRTRNFWREHFDACAQKTDDVSTRSSFFSKTNTVLLHQTARSLIGERHDCRILDAGCAEGEVTRPYTKNNLVVGLDFSSGMAALARKNGIQMVQGDITAPPFAAQTFDVVVCIEVVTLLPDPQSGIAALADMVAPGGALVLSVLNAQSLLRKMATPLFRMATDHIPTPIVYDTAVNTLHRCGLRVEETRFSHLLPFKSIATDGQTLQALQLLYANNILFHARRPPC